MGTIFCLIGKSSSGKDTLFNELIKDKDLNLIPIIPYTTRPKRSNELNGVHYRFIHEDNLRDYEQAGLIIEKRVYNTVNGVWVYCTIDDGQIDLEHNNYILIGTLEGYKLLRRYFGNPNVVPIYIEVEDQIRLERAMHREKQQATPNYQELCRRFLADSADFSVDNLILYGVPKIYYNEDLSECLTKIKFDIETLLNSFKGPGEN
ncbi:Guanylate kinase [Desulfosporosinus sp. I2]|uniref:guanylate kinase n=1 Tax=Desulfosporosinus sp. I2 TaxID=1617025 RepID=UPI0005F06574|nr:guanylate kinase [Desulfosporosinus sp. I2]KJR47894.1 Guanylate kinase [Desulfosporosinus sp. I2]